jgi:uncharacterized membrane protein YgdD (TMEM256/DUF423 family)
MNEATRLLVTIAAVAMAAAVALGAFGAHALRDRLQPDQLTVWSTAVQYHVYHALGLLAVAWVAHLLPESAAVRWSGWLMLGGIVVFSGSLYVLVLSGARWLGAITPLGGVTFIAAWVLLAVAAWRA